MRKTINMIAGSLEDFWFNFLLVIIASLAALQIAPVMEFSNFALSGGASTLGGFLWRACLYFVFPVGTLSLILIIIKRLPDKKDDVLNFWLPIFYILVTVSLLFVLIASLNNLQYRINNIVPPTFNGTGAI